MILVKFVLWSLSFPVAARLEQYVPHDNSRFGLPSVGRGGEAAPAAPGTDTVRTGWQRRQHQKPKRAIPGSSDCYGEGFGCDGGVGSNPRPGAVNRSLNLASKHPPTIFLSLLFREQSALSSLRTR
jgi:hypothetical protein